MATSKINDELNAHARNYQCVFWMQIAWQMNSIGNIQGLHYVILALPTSLFLMQQQKNHQKMYRKRKGKQTFFVSKQD